MENIVSAVSAENIISAVQKRPVLWDATGGKKLKLRREAWAEVMSELVSNYEELSSEQKTEFEEGIKGRWKNLRTAFHREEKTRKEGEEEEEEEEEDDGEDDGEDNSKEQKRKKYKHYESLLFLKAHTSTKKTDATAKKRKVELSSKVEDEDEDRMFLFSCHSKLKSLPEDLKEEVKLHFLTSLTQACRTARQRAYWQQQQPPQPPQPQQQQQRNAFSMQQTSPPGLQLSVPEHVPVTLSYSGRSTYVPTTTPDTWYKDLVFDSIN